MADEGFKRKLAAILSADVEGYSRLMGEDEDATIRTLTSYRELMSTLIQKHRGRVVDSPGDNLLAEFLSVVDAVRCAVEIQEELRVRNAELPENRRMIFRIGINLGDVVEEGDRIYGDGINIAARVEGLAEGGGICISGTVYDSIKNKLSLGYKSMGEHTVKNIKEPVRVYRMRIGPEAATPVVREEKAGSRRWQKATLAAVVVLVVMAGAWAIWNFYFHKPPIEPASIEKMAFPLPDKPSIAVLPFVNMSGDSEQEYFCDGLTEDMITALSKIPDLFIIARNSVFTYKGKPVIVKQVAEELGVRYVLEGSVRIAEQRVRINVQLIDAITGGHLWAERYDRNLEDVFALQDEITMKVLTALQVKLTEGEKIRAMTRSTDDINAYLKWTEGRQHFLRLNRDGNVKARQLLEEAIALDPMFSSPYVDLAWTHIMGIRFGLSKSPKESLKQATQLAQKAISLDESSPFGHSVLGAILTAKRQYKEAIAQGEKAVALNPGDSLAMAHLGRTLGYTGRYEESLVWFEKAIRQDPKTLNWYFNMVGHCYLYMGRLEEALEALKKNRNPNDQTNRIRLAAVYSLLGREEDASAQAAEILRLNPKFSIKSIARWPIKNKEDLDLMMNALRKAGLPE